MGGHIDAYLDLSSFYSYLAFVYVLKNREALAAHDVIIDFHPVFLGGINQGSGNKPPWSLPAKAAYGNFDSARAKKYHSMENIKVPPFFPPVTLLPQRALCYVKANFAASIFEKAWMALFHDLWIPPHVNVTMPADLAGSLTKTGLFSAQEVDAIVKSAGEKEWKDALLANTKNVLDQGAFGAPWFWVKNSEGKEEPFFGSDRFHFMWTFMGVPWRDIEILPKGDEKAKL